jgi:ESS family glutamate:Na+ symporter
MKIPFPFEAMLVFAYLGVMLLVGVVLRAKIRLLQTFLFPSCLIGGVFGLIVLQTGAVRADAELLEAFAYHLFNISFISVGLTPADDSGNPSPRREGLIKGSWWQALVQGITFPLQASVGGLVVVLGAAVGLELFPSFGFLVPIGFTEGPGQALSMGKVWEGFGFEHAATIGLTFGAIGFFFAFFVGVPLVNRGIRKGRAVHGIAALPKDLLVGVISEGQERESAGQQTMHSANIDTLAFQAALVGLVYLLTYWLVTGLGSILPPDAGSILWGFFFFFGMAIALIIRHVMGRLGVARSIDPGVQRRVTGWAVDFLIVATVMAIQVTTVRKFLLPVSVMAVASGIVTTMVVVYFGNRVWSYNLERTVAVYGTVTGTVSSGLLLLRIVDPEFRTGVAIEIGLMNVFAVPIIVTCMVLANAPIWWGWSVGLTVLAFMGILAICLAVLRLGKFWGPRCS